MDQLEKVIEKTELSLKAADNIRILAAAMVEKAQSGHPGGPMGGADFIHILYTEFLQYDPDEMKWPFRDRFFLDAGHMSAMLYAVHTLLGNITMEEIKNFRQWKSPTPGHPELDVERGIENTSGPLGQGHSFGVGAAIAERFLATRFGEQIAHKTFLYISDGGIQEEISQGAGRIAGHLGLGNIVMFYDANDIQLSTEVDVVTHEDTAKKYQAWGWHTMTIDGNDHDQIRNAIQQGINETDRPTLIIGKTIMGKGVKKEDGSPYEGEVELHGKPIGSCKASFDQTIQSLGGDPSDPFVIFDDVAEYYKEILQQKRAQSSERRLKIETWKKLNRKKAAQLEEFITGKLPMIDWQAIEQKPNVASRNASAAVLSHLADHVGNMIVSSADLCNSDKTDGFLKKTQEFKRGDFSGAFLQAGVSELTMAALSTGMALHGGVIPVCGTFFAFSDFMKPAIRLCALMEQQVIFIWTHDAFRVGEDGPTHQPVEQEAQIRLLEQLKNHSGKNSFLALRPADAAETTACWKLAFENRDSPTGLILSRQTIKELPGENRKKEAFKASRGAYVVKDCEGEPDVLLLANGSEVSTLVDGSMKLAEDGIRCRVISAPSEGLFRQQSKDYQDSIIPSGIPVFGLTAGLPVTLKGLAGPNSRIWGMESFGYSAPFEVLDEKLGFTAENVYREVKEFLGR